MVTELVYRLEFTNPGRPAGALLRRRADRGDGLLARHGKRLPKPKRVVRNVSGLEVRINATNGALQPHAGGMIRFVVVADRGRDPASTRASGAEPGHRRVRVLPPRRARTTRTWRSCSPRDRAGARTTSAWRRVLRTELRGDDLQTNLPVHYGLVQWFLGKGVRRAEHALHAVAAVALQQVVNDFDLLLAWRELRKRVSKDAHARRCSIRRETLILRPLTLLLENPHLLGGFLGRYDGVLWTREGGHQFHANPIRFLERLYDYLDLEWTPSKPPSEKIWDHDHEVLERAERFTTRCRTARACRRGTGIEALFASGHGEKLCGRDGGALAERPRRAPRLPGRARAAAGDSADRRALGLPRGHRRRGPGAALPRASPTRRRSRSRRALAPPPPASADEILTPPMGGTFYAREAPNLPLLIEVGQHFDAGQPLFIIEVMKMFNKISAPFSGTVVENLMENKDGTVVAKASASSASSRTSASSPSRRPPSPRAAAP